MRIYTRKGDDGTTGLLYGGRVAKDAPGPMAYGEVDEAQAAIGTARAHAPRPSGAPSSTPCSCTSKRTCGC
jgi:cob(I)alamin adenosyltransferase